jgi:hypothetical protein
MINAAALCVVFNQPIAADFRQVVGTPVLINQQETYQPYYITR